MAISDLTGTTWVLNNTAAGAVAFNYSVNVLFDDTIYSYFVGRYSGGYDCYVYGVGNSAGVIPTHILSQWGGSTSIVETGSIKFLGGSDVTNSTLISWFETNATQIGPVPSIIQNLFIGQQKMINGYLGNARISQIYYGNILVWERDDGPTPVIDNLLITSEGNYLVDINDGYLITAPPTSGNN